MTLEQIEKFLEQNVGFLATRGTCGNPRVRPIQSPLLKNGKLYFCTRPKKGLFKHISAHSGVEICALNSEYVFLRLRANAVLCEDSSVRAAMIEKFKAVIGAFADEICIMELQNISAILQKGEEKIDEFKS